MDESSKVFLVRRGPPWFYGFDLVAIDTPYSK